MDAQRQPRQSETGDPQLELPLAPAAARGEAPGETAVRVEAFISDRGNQSPASPLSVMQEVLNPENLTAALEQVMSNKGAAGIDGMTVDELPDFLRARWPGIKQQLLDGTYKPQPVRRVQIPKPDGGVRKLGIPTDFGELGRAVLDRLIQQAVQQGLTRRWDKTFSQNSFGFRPGRSAHQADFGELSRAVAQAQQYIAQGRGWVVDIDLEKFFDQVNHDRLMGRIMKRENDKALLKLIRSMLSAGVMEAGLVSPTDEGTPRLD
jgi:RNA-directed DNA polymerase